MAKEIEIPDGYEAKIAGNKVVFEPKESEEEKIRKSLIQFLTDIKNISESGRTSWAVRREDAEMCNSFLAYLEKQKDEAQKQFTLGMQAGREEVLYEIEKQKEQKPKQETWANLSNCIHDCKNCKGKCFYRKEEYQEHVPAEWSEEDECILKRLIRDYNEAVRSSNGNAWGKEFQENLNWLKRLRPQPKQ